MVEKIIRKEPSALVKLICKYFSFMVRQAVLTQISPEDGAEIVLHSAIISWLFTNIYKAQRLCWADEPIQEKMFF